MTTKTPARTPMTVEKVRTEARREVSDALEMLKDRSNPSEVARKLSRFCEAEASDRCQNMEDCWNVVMSYHYSARQTAYHPPSRAVMKSGNLPHIIHATAIQIVLAIWTEEMATHLKAETDGLKEVVKKSS